MALVGQAYNLKCGRTAARTRECVTRQMGEDCLERGMAPAMSWGDHQLSQLFFGKSEAHIFQ
ncbi:Acyl-CoA desaturase [Phytophthora megakarya]|uniref:Acyl-CoA desaturase n=1 Tax=Phytophthora megakarya TaxID=4795 RepID=A0A225W1V7_9STRA|nr:Acyl-CoA desaturase [Phytophthora megakarya]